MPEAFKLGGRMWNVGLAKDLVATRAPSVEVPVAPQYEAWLTDQLHRTADGGWARPSGARWVIVDEEHAMSEVTDLSVPLIAADLGDQYLVIDGWHRIYKAYHTGVASLPCRVLTEAETNRCELPA
jgi:hypothetical protein